MSFWLQIFPLIIAITILTPGCGTNPVTGESELQFISTTDEITLGTKSYVPSRQQQGGDYVADPEVQRYVESVGRRIAAVGDRQLPYEFRVVNDSTPNAWALPGGKIAVNRGLLVELKNEAELAAVLAHEIVHAAARHGAKDMQFDALLKGTLLLGSLALRNKQYQDAALAGASFGADLLNRKYGRDAEREADHYGILYMQRAGYDPRAAVDLQATFLRLETGHEPGWIDGLFASHPPSQERLEKNKLLVAGLPSPAGELGRERYQQHIARLIRTQPAYKAYDEARKAQNDKDSLRALKLLDLAVSLEPDEALFYGLRAEVLATQGQTLAAQREVDKALALNHSHYEFFLTRALVRNELGNRSGAQRDFERSERLLPTTTAWYELGRLALEKGRSTEAIDYFRKAAGDDSAMGKSAFVHLAKLDLPANPGNYVNARVARAPDGYLVLVLENRAPLTVGELHVVVGASRLLGLDLKERGRYELTEPVEPGQSVSIKTPLGPFSEEKALKYAAKVIHAEILE